MIVVLIRLLIVALIIYLFYRGIAYLMDPRRKLDDAHKHGSYYFHDDRRNARKNFFITFKGALFEGEKYLGSTETSLEIVSIFVWAKDKMELQGLTRDDFLFLEKEILKNYPDAQISWKNPIEQLMK